MSDHTDHELSSDELSAQRQLCTGGLPLCDPDGSVNSDALAHALDHVLRDPAFPTSTAEQEMRINETFAAFIAMMAADRFPIILLDLDEVCRRMDSNSADCYRTDR